MHTAAGIDAHRWVSSRAETKADVEQREAVWRLKRRLSGHGTGSQLKNTWSTELLGCMGAVEWHIAQAATAQVAGSLLCTAPCDLLISPPIIHRMGQQRLPQAVGLLLLFLLLLLLLDS